MAHCVRTKESSMNELPKKPVVVLLLLEREVGAFRLRRYFNRQSCHHRLRWLYFLHTTDTTDQQRPCKYESIAFAQTQPGWYCVFFPVELLRGSLTSMWQLCRDSIALVACGLWTVKNLLNWFYLGKSWSYTQKKHLVHKVYGQLRGITFSIWI